MITENSLHGREKWVCKYCQEEFYSIDEFAVHILAHHRKSQVARQIRKNTELMARCSK